MKYLKNYFCRNCGKSIFQNIVYLCKDCEKLYPLVIFLKPQNPYPKRKIHGYGKKIMDVPIDITREMLENIEKLQEPNSDFFNTQMELDYIFST